MADSSLCRRCGKCCCRKMLVGDEVVYLPLHCEHYAPGARLCTIYDRRHELNPRCLTVEEGVRVGVFPVDCPYVSGVADYRPPREECTEEELQLYFEQSGDENRI